MQSAAYQYHGYYWSPRKCQICLIIWIIWAERITANHNRARLQQCSMCPLSVHAAIVSAVNRGRGRGWRRETKQEILWFSDMRLVVEWSLHSTSLRSWDEEFLSFNPRHQVNELFKPSNATLKLCAESRLDRAWRAENVWYRYRPVLGNPSTQTQYPPPPGPFTPCYQCYPCDHQLVTSKLDSLVMCKYIAGRIESFLFRY